MSPKVFHTWEPHGFALRCTSPGLCSEKKDRLEQPRACSFAYIYIYIDYCMYNARKHQDSNDLGPPCCLCCFCSSSFPHSSERNRRDGAEKELGIPSAHNSLSCGVPILASPAPPPSPPWRGVPGPVGPKRPSTQWPRSAEKRPVSPVGTLEVPTGTKMGPRGGGKRMWHHILLFQNQP